MVNNMHCFQGHCPSTCHFCMKKMSRCNVNRTCKRTQFNIITIILSTCPIFWGKHHSHLV